MPPSIFKPVERAFILERLKGWLDMRGCGKERDNDGDLYNPRDRYVDATISLLFERFPERDSAQSPQGTEVFSVKERDALHTRIKNLFYNAAARQKALPDEGQALTLNKHVSPLMLFKQRYQDEIMNRRATLTDNKDPVELLKAYNEVVRIEYNALEQNCPEDFQELDRIAQQMRKTAKLPFHELDGDVQEMVLQMLPTWIACAVKEWERRTGAFIYVLSLWWTPAGVPESFK
ncbi:hypothetical protein FRC08_018702 [Ceratobasidium sp. 394]|nr:hypothetical protein FRC08_018702 [Ceratobasidium sp. 394]